MSKRKLYILSGLVGIGKTSALQSWMGSQKEVAGILSPKEDGVRYFEDIKTGGRFRMDKASGDVVKVGYHSFDKEAFDWATANINRAIDNQAPYLVIDEIGPLEISQEKGLHQVLIKTLERYTGTLIIVVRQRSLESFVEKYSLVDYKIIFQPSEIERPVEMSGLVLGGGESRRMEQDKAFLNYFGKPQWAHSVQQLAPFCQRVIVSINERQAQDWRKPEIAVVDAKQHAMSGPLGGVMSYLDRYPETERIFILACDYPRVKIDHLALLAMHKTKMVDAICFSDASGRIEPMITILLKSGIQKLKEYYDHQGRSMSRFLKEADTLIVEPVDAAFLRSVNTKEEYLQFLQQLNQNTSRKFNIHRLAPEKDIAEVIDYLAIEEPLEIHLEMGPYHNRQSENLSVTMRTPLHDEDLAIGFMFTEGLLTDADMLDFPVSLKKSENSITVRLKPDAQFDLQSIKRNFYTTSSCGVCGKESIEAIHQTCPIRTHQEDIGITEDVLKDLPKTLRQKQAAFDSTGGIHAAAFFDETGKLVSMREDVGRHNALDKLIGAALLQEKAIPDCGDKVLLLSGRASFELVQKAAMAGVQIVAAIGAPSTLAVATARDFGMTLIGFLKANSFNIYCGHERVKL